MRIVEFVGFVVVAIAAFGWMIGHPHTLASVRRDAARARDAADDRDRKP